MAKVTWVEPVAFFRARGEDPSLGTILLRMFVVSVGAFALFHGLLYLGRMQGIKPARLPHGAIVIVSCIGIGFLLGHVLPFPGFTGSGHA